MKKYLFLDIETTGLKELDDKIHGIAVMHGEDEEPQYLPMWDLPEWFIKELADPNVIKVIHSGKRFDLIFLQRAGLEINGPIHDTLFIYKSINENMPLGLKQLTEKYRGKEYLKSKRALNQACDKAGVKNVAGLCRMDLKDAEHEHFDIIAKYAVEDVENTCFLYFKGKELLNKTWNSIKKMYGDKGQSPAQLLAKSVFPIDSVQLKIDKRGVKANMDLLNQIRKEKEIERDRLRSQMYELHKDYVDQWEEDAYQRVVAGRASDRGKKSVKRHHKASNYCTLFNWDSSKHVAPLVYKHLNVPEQFHKFTEKTGELTLDKNAVNEMLTGLLPGHKAIKFLKLYKEYKKVHKIASTYTGNAKTGLFSKIRNGRLWTKYYQTPRTWRWASSGPNLQNIPRAGVTQEFFVPDSRKLQIKSISRQSTV